MNVATSIFDWFHFQQYGLIVVVAILISCFVSYWRVKVFHLAAEPFLELTIGIVFWGLCGGRLYYVLINWPYYYTHPADILAVSRGGFAIHGAFLMAALFAVLYLKLRRLPLGQYADALAPGLILGQAVGQWANLIHQEAIGLPTNLPWAIYVDYAFRPVGYEANDYFQPAFIYQSALDFAVFLLLLFGEKLDRKKRIFGSGRLFLVYVLLQSAGRFFVERIRLDSEVLGGVNVAQAGCAFFMILTVLLLVVSFTADKPLRPSCYREKR